MKKCSRSDCIHGIELQPLKNFYPDKRAKDGYQSHCRDCHHVFYELYRQKPKIELQGKICSNVECIHLGILQPINNFYSMKNTPDGYANHCKNCKKKEALSYYYENRDTISDKIRERRKEGKIPSRPLPHKKNLQRKARTVIASAIVPGKYQKQMNCCVLTVVNKHRHIITIHMKKVNG